MLSQTAPLHQHRKLKNLHHRSFIPLARPSVNEDDIRLVSDVLRSGMLVQGEYVMKLENVFAELHQAKHAIAVANGTASLHLALKVLGIAPGDEVIVPALSYMATANVVELVGATCVFVDVDESTFNIDISKIEEKITAKTKVIIPVHEFGLACDIAAVCSLAANYNLQVIEDAACALGATQHNKYVGTFGKLGAFSLHPRKSITSGEGGVLLTNDDALAKKLRQLRNHGIENANGRAEFVEAGFNYRLTDFQAALAWSQLQRLPQILAAKANIAKQYFSSITNTKLTLPQQPANRNHTWQTFHLLLNDELHQKQTIEKLKAQSIGTNYGAQCIPAQTYYAKKYKLDAAGLFPNAYRTYSKGLAIPMHEHLTPDDVTYIVQALNQL